MPTTRKRPEYSKQTKRFRNDRKDSSTNPKRKTTTLHNCTQPRAQSPPNNQKKQPTQHRGLLQTGGKETPRTRNTNHVGPSNTQNPPNPTPDKCIGSSTFGGADRDPQCPPTLMRDEADAVRIGNRRLGWQHGRHAGFAIQLSRLRLSKSLFRWGRR
jgi:hypothetical protein